MLAITILCLTEHRQWQLFLIRHDVLCEALSHFSHVQQYSIWMEFFLYLYHVTFNEDKIFALDNY
jgi:hypothetical protein